MASYGVPPPFQALPALGTSDRRVAREDRLVEGPSQIGVFRGTTFGAVELKEVPTIGLDLGEERPERLRCRTTMGNAEIVEEALRLGRPHVGEVAAGPTMV